MCGIAGYIGNGNRNILNSMIQCIRYRGPNAQEVHVGENIGFAHARLSILDLRVEGNQPMFNFDGSLMITFNGEIYNYLELRNRFLKKYHFKTNTDTEVLLYMYCEFGEDMLSQIHGMFAFAIHDFKSNKTLVARDRMGKKPFYYTNLNDTFIFSSELKALFKYPGVSRKINISSVNEYLTFDYSPAPNTIVENIYKLEPSSFLILHHNRVIKKSKYWINNLGNVKSDYSFQKSTSIFGNLLSEATQTRLVSDVPLGVFLSGGLDSSAIAYFAQKNSESKIKTFSIGFEEESYNESNYAQQVSNYLKTDHYTRNLTPSKTLSLIEEIFPYLDEPFADASIIPTYFLSDFAKEHVDVALGGDGSDELMAGYPTFISDYFKFPFLCLPKSTIKYILRASNSIIPVSDKNISFDFKFRQFLKGFLSSKNYIHQLWMGSFSPDEKYRLFNINVYDLIQDKEGLSIIDYHLSQKDNLSNFDKFSLLYQQTYLVDDILYKVDRASMLNSLEVRAPFLDTHVVEFINSLPESFKLKGFSGKYILKCLMQDKLPSNIINRPKKGFGIPLSAWIKNELKNEVTSVLSSAPIELFNHNYINIILRNHFSGKENNRKLIWNLFVLCKYIKNNKLEL